MRRSSQYGGSGGAAVRTEAVRRDDRPAEAETDDPNIVYEESARCGSIEGVWYYTSGEFERAKRDYLARKAEKHDKFAD